MAKIDLITLSGLTARDGSMIVSGATIKFSTTFDIGDTNVKVFPRIFRNRIIFEAGYDNIQISSEILPDEMHITDLTEEEFYALTPQKLYEVVRDRLNVFYGSEIIEINVTP